MLSRLGEAVRDAAETLRRAFKDQPTRGVALGLEARGRGAFGALAAPVRQGLEALAAVPGDQGLLPRCLPRRTDLGFAAALAGGGAWSTWEGGAKLVEMPVFRAERCARLAVPPLPRAPKVAGLASSGFATRTRRALEALRAPGTRAVAPALGAPGTRGVAPGLGLPGTRRGLDLALRMPVAVEGIDLRSAPRAVQMRYGMLAVRATGENVRNLELLGRFMVPRKGVRELRHDARTGRLLVLLGPEAAGARKDPLLIARRRDDQGLITTFLEEA